LLLKYVNIIKAAMADLNFQKLSDEGILDIAVSSSEELQGYGLTDRFSAITNLKAQTLNIHKHSANSASYYVDEQAIDIDIRVEALLALSRSIRHTSSYLTLINKSRQKTIDLIARDHNLVKNLKRWAANDEVLDEPSIKKVLKRIQKHQTTATNAFIRDFCSVTVHASDLVYVNEPGRWLIVSGKGRIKRITSGSFHGELSSSSLKNRKIKINTNTETGWNNDPVRVCGVEHHEIIHDQGFQLAENYNPSDFRLGELNDDAQLWVELKLQKATVPSRILSVYKAQFHEVIAHEQQKLFKEELAPLLGTENVSTCSIKPSIAA